MKKGLIFGLGVLLGAGGGGFIAHTILKQQYAQKADEEIASCRAAFLNELNKRRKETEEKEKKEAKEAAKEAIETYSGEPEKASEMIEKADDPFKPPYEIAEEIYDDPANPYKSAGLIFFPNEGIVIRDDQSIMEHDDLDAAVGIQSLEKFDEDTDRIIIRNDKFQTDYEISQSGISYTEWKKKHPGK